MYVLVDLSVNPPLVQPWLDSLRDQAGAPIGVQRFAGTRFAALDITPAQVESGRAQKLLIHPAESLRFPAIRPAGDPIRVDRVPMVVPWNQLLIGIRDLAATGAGIRVGHIDSGIDPDHPSVAGHPTAFASIRQNGTTVIIDSNATASDSANHGTATASLIAGKAPLGMAPGVELFSAGLCGPLTVPMVVAAVSWLLEHDVQIVWLGVERPNERDPALETLVTDLLQQNILPVTAIGNSGPGTSSSPGNCADGLSTGAVSEGTSEPTMWNQSGSQMRPDERLKPDVVAPGDKVMIAYTHHLPSGPDYQVIPHSGTSLAGPHLVALAALCLELQPALTARDLMQRIFDSCRLFNLDHQRANRGVPWARDIRLGP